MLKYINNCYEILDRAKAKGSLPDSQFCCSLWARGSQGKRKLKAIKFPASGSLYCSQGMEVSACIRPLRGLRSSLPHGAAP